MKSSIFVIVKIPEGMRDSLPLIVSTTPRMEFYMRYLIIISPVL